MCLFWHGRSFYQGLWFDCFCSHRTVHSKHSSSSLWGLLRDFTSCLSEIRGVQGTCAGWEIPVGVVCVASTWTFQELVRGGHSFLACIPGSMCRGGASVSPGSWVTSISRGCTHPPRPLTYPPCTRSTNALERKLSCLNPLRFQARSCHSIVP